MKVYLIIKEPLSVTEKDKTGRTFHPCPTMRSVGSKIRLSDADAKLFLKHKIVKEVKDGARKASPKPPVNDPKEDVQ